MHVKCLGEICAPDQRTVGRKTASVAVVAMVVLCCMSLRASAGEQNNVELPPAGRVLELMRRVCDYQLKQPPPRKDPINGWAHATFYVGVMATYRATQEQAYLDAALRWARDQSNFTPPRTNSRLFADDLCCGQVYVDLYAIEHDEACIKPLREMIEPLLADHKAGREEWHWCDALFMAPPMLAHLSAATGDARYLDLMDELWWDATDYLYDEQAHLFYRDKRFFDRRRGDGRKIFWSRGNGWVMAGMAGVLSYLPQEHPSRQRYVALFREMAQTVASAQSADGLWRSDLLNPEAFPLPETSGTGLFCYALAWGINRGILERDVYLPVVVRA